MPGAGVTTFWSNKRPCVGCVDLQCLAMPRPRTEFKFYITEFRVAVVIAHLRPGIDITNLYTPGLISTVIAERKENQLSCWIEIRSAAVSVTVPVLWPEQHWQHPSLLATLTSSLQEWCSHNQQRSEGSQCSAHGVTRVFAKNYIKLNIQFYGSAKVGLLEDYTLSEMFLLSNLTWMASAYCTVQQVWLNCRL